MPSSADSQRGRLDGVAPDCTDTGGVDLRLTAERSGSVGACLWMREAFVPVLDELTALQADAIRPRPQHITVTLTSWCLN